MPKETNLNVSPYFDDFDSSKNFYQVLFKPGYPIQSRELTTLQTILQNQVEQFGNYFFKEGSVVIPGQLSYNNEFFAVEVEAEFLGVSVASYGEDIVGKVIKGQSSGVTAKVIYYLDESAEKNTVTFYINYLNSGELTNKFENSEVLLFEEDFTSGSIIISQGQGFANTISSNSTAIGSAVILSEGVYYIRGQFVNVYDQTLILDSHSNKPTYKVGFEVVETIVSADEDSSLSDNARGFNNFSAPGADRFKISATLVKRSVNSDQYPSFIQLLEIRDGVIVDRFDNPSNNPFAEELARRTFDESGNYYVKPFTVTARESLNDKIGNQGLFTENQLTYDNNTPSDDLAIYKVSPGKAYIRGFEVDKLSATLKDVEKPRTTNTLSDQSTNYFTGSTLELNRVYGSPKLDISAPTILSLRDQRVGSDQTAQPGKEVGVARVYDFALESGSYDTAQPDSNTWDLSLFDIQPYTEFTVNQSATISIPTRIVGKSSGAVGFLRYSTSAGTAITAYNVKGRFLAGETLEFDSTDQTRATTAVVEYGVSDVKSVYGIVGTASTFTADVKQNISQFVGQVKITGAGVVTSSSFQFSSRAKVGDIVSYSKSGNTVPSFARITSVGNKTCNIAAVESVAGICDGTVSGTQNPSDFAILTTQYQSTSDNTLFTELPKSVVANVGLTTATAVIRKEFSVAITSNSTGAITAGLNETFLPFDEERYVLTRNDGVNEELTADKFVFGSGGSTVTINGLGTDDVDSKLIATLTKTNLKAKVKNRNKVKSIIVDKSTNGASGVGTTTANDGLVYGNYPYGTRVQDEEICINNPDSTKLLAVVESSGTSTPNLERIGLSQLNGPSSRTTDLVIGERLVGSISNAVAVYAERIDDLTISVVYLNENKFDFDEEVSFKESGIAGVVDAITAGDVDITSNYTLESGYRDTIYDYSRIVRKQDSTAPSKKLKIVYEYASFDPSDTGDFVVKNSYDQYDYCDIPKTNGISNADILDIRPRVAEYTPAENIRSPFEFYGRTFDSSGTAKNILASDESVVMDIEYYLPRIDRIYMTRDGQVTLSKGEPSDNPVLPQAIDDALEIGTVNLPAYLCKPEDLQIKLVEHKRYRMQDIALLEDRISNLEFYTTLSLLESSAENLQIQDANGRNRFKSGFVVDNFTSMDAQNKDHPRNNSIDPIQRELRPEHYCTQIDLEIGSNAITGIGSVSDPDKDFFTIKDKDLVGTGIRRTGTVLTLDYKHKLEVDQPFATRVESVTPYLVTSYSGTILLAPSSDIWIATNQLKPNTVEIDNFTAVSQQLQATAGFDQNGFGPKQWNAWETNWTSTSSSSKTKSTGGGGSVKTTTTTTKKGQTRTGEQTVLTPKTDTYSQGNSVVSTEVIPFMRSRNIEFTSRNNRPLTELYPFFAGVDMSEYAIPKLIEISMISGTFQVGETVEVKIPSKLNAKAKDVGTFRVAKSNHKYGSYKNPTDTFTVNPYDRDTNVQKNYSPTSSTINVDTFSLSKKAQGKFNGYIKKGSKIRGLTSNAEATISDVRLITDDVGTLIGSLFIPPSGPGNASAPSFETGENEFTLTSSPTNSTAYDPIGSFAETTFFAQGTQQNVQEKIISVKSAQFSTKKIQDERVTTDVKVKKVVTPPPPRDPLAQTFRTAAEGLYVTKCEVFFKNKDDKHPCIAQLRTVSLGTPTEEIIPFSEVVLDPSEISLSDDGSKATTIKYQAPIYLNGDTEYALVLLSDSKEYTVFISRMGEVDISTASGPESQQIVVTEQPNLGSLFKSQNGSTWTPSQYEDLKFRIYRAEFTSTVGNITFYNPELSKGNEQIPLLVNNPLEISSDNIRVGLGTTVQDTGLVLGNTVSQANNNASGNYVGSAGSAFGSMTVTNAGLGYEPTSGSLTYNNVSLVAVSGKGKNGTANISITNGSAVSAEIASGGSGYRIGDVVTVSQLGSSTLGRDLQLTITELGGINELILDDVEGDFEVSATKQIQFFNAATNTTVDLNSAIGGDVLVSSIESNSDGLHIKVNHKNHGMHSQFNIVEISDVSSDSIPTSLTSKYNKSSSADIELEDSNGFNFFEGQEVSPTNLGYALIDDEIISYSGTNGKFLTGITRGIDSTNSFTYDAKTAVVKYENSGVSLRRINKTHDLSDATVTDPIGLDYYHIKLDMSSNGLDRSVGTTYPKLYLKGKKSTGGGNVYASQNIPFEVIRPTVTNMVVNGTQLTASVRTLSGTSIDTSQTSFIDRGFENIILDGNNYFSDSRIVASNINEDQKLNNDTLPGKKSFTLNMELSTNSDRVSPLIDLERVGVVFITNKVNNAIKNFATDDRVATIDGDPSAFTYVTDDVELEFNATSIKVRFAAYTNIFSDVRVLYAVSNDRETNPIFYPFPGYENLDINGDVINPANNNGLPDTSNPKTDVLGFEGGEIEFRDYEFTIDNLPSFKHFSIKVVGNCTNQAYPPRIRDFTAIALA